MSDNPIFSLCRSVRAGFGFSRAGFGSVCVGSESARAGFAGRRSGAVLAAAVLVFFVLIVSSCSCGGGRTDDGGQPVAFPFPEAPLMVQQQGPVAVAEYLCGHFWNDYLDTSRIFPDSDTLFLGVTRAALKDAVRNYAYLADVVSSDPEVFLSNAATFRSTLENLLGRAASLSGDGTCPELFRCLADDLSLYFYDPNSPYRNEELYAFIASVLAESPLVDETLRGRYRFEQGLCSLNPPGSVASDFAFTDRDGKVSTMHSVNADYTIMFFTNPGCNACSQIIDMLMSFRTSSGLGLSDLIVSGKVAVLNIYIDSDIEAWMDYSASYPADWHNGYDPYGILRDNSLYAIRAIPSLYLLDSEKRVLFKDAVPEKVIAYLQGRVD